MSRRRFSTALIALLLLTGVTAASWAQANVQQTIRYGEVLSVERTVVVENKTGSGSRAGSTVGAVAGYALSDGRDRWLGALVGGVLGGAAGNAAENSARKKKGWQLILRMEDDGSETGVQVVGKKQKHQVGDRVRLLTGGGKTQVTTVAN